MRAVLFVWLFLGTVYPTKAACPQVADTGPYTFIASVPDTCQQANCDYYLAVKPHASDPSYVNFWIEGNAAGYVAVGLSTSGSMGDSDVLACAVDPQTRAVVLIDAYNPPSLIRAHERDTIQNLCMYSANFSNGRIYCSFSRLIDTGDTLQDKTLNASYYLLYAAVNTPPGGSNSSLSLSYHSSQTPARSTTTRHIINQSPTTQSTTATTPTSLGCPPAPGSEPYSFTATIPANCTQASCSYYLAVKTNRNNPLYLDFVLEGNAANGYVAVGFSPDGKMALSDVLACAIDSSSAGGAAVVDAYNTAGYNNVRDTLQNVCPHATMVINGHVKCSFSRLIDTGDILQDKILNASYYLLYAAVNTPPVGSGSTLHLQKHSQTPSVTSSPVNIVTASGAAPVARHFPREALTKVHAILMLLAWPLLATTGIFFAAWMKPALPPPPLPATWFKVHRFIMLASMFIGAAGFVFIFVANANTNSGLISFENRPSAVMHFVIGIVVMALHIINPIISAFRCLPDHPRRWIFNLFHGSLIGTVVLLLALTNCGIGVSLFDNSILQYILGVYLAFVVLTFLLLVVLFIVFTAIAISVGGEEGPKLGPAMLKPILAYYFRKKDANASTIQMLPTQQSLHDKDSAQKNADEANVITEGKSTGIGQYNNVEVRWISLAFFLIIAIQSIIVLVVLVAIQSMHKKWMSCLS